MKVFLFVICLLQVQLLWAQDAAAITKELATLVPDLPGMITDDDLRACIQNETAVIPGEAYSVLGIETSPLLAEKHVGIGKITTKTTTIFLIAEVRTPDSDSKYAQLVTVACYTLDNKTGERVYGGLQHYLTMSGDDAKHRQGEINYENGRVRFITVSTNIEDGEDAEVERSFYKVGKKVLEFDGN